MNSSHSLFSSSINGDTVCAHPGPKPPWGFVNMLDFSILEEITEIYTSFQKAVKYHPGRRLSRIFRQFVQPFRVHCEVFNIWKIVQRLIPYMV